MVEEQQFDPGGIRGDQGKVDAFRSQAGSQRPGAADPDRRRGGLWLGGSGQWGEGALPFKLRGMAGSTSASEPFLTLPPPPTAGPEPGRPPRRVRPDLWLFAPNRRTQGGSSWLLEGDPRQARPDLLIDAPAWNAANHDHLLQRRAKVGADAGLIVVTGREGHGEIGRWQALLGWPLLLQEQEAYLLPGVQRLRPFASALEPAPGLRLLWTPGPSPGSCVLHVQGPELDALFCGRLLVPLAPGLLGPLRTARTFHWSRQLASLRQLLAWLPLQSPEWIATGAALGALRGQVLVPDAARMLRTLAPQ